MKHVCDLWLITGLMCSHDDHTYNSPRDTQAYIHQMIRYQVETELTTCLVHNEVEQIYVHMRQNIYI